jgi:hypothetical protein
MAVKMIFGGLPKNKNIFKDTEGNVPGRPER